MQPAQQPLPVATTVVTTPTVTPANTDAAIAAMAATNDKLMNQLQTEYSQKVTDFSNQSKALQDQMQTLSSRVAGLESQLSQLVQTITRQTGMGGTTSLNVVPAQQPAPIVEPKITYNVQAIIPGRAWLKSDNGETLTVAEGDTIKELGRVSKIDPYDGVVEVNTGNKTVSISYGSGG
jgi:intracellular multiplication protein IcmG